MSVYCRCLPSVVSSFCWFLLYAMDTLHYEVVALSCVHHHKRLTTISGPEKWSGVAKSLLNISFPQQCVHGSFQTGSGVHHHRARGYKHAQSSSPLCISFSPIINGWNGIFLMLHYLHPPDSWSFFPPKSCWACEVVAVPSSSYTRSENMCGISESSLNLR